MVKLYFLALFLFYTRARSYSENQNEKLDNNINYPAQVYSSDDNYIHEEESYTHDSRRADSDRIANYGEDSYTDTDSPEDDLQIKRYYYIPSFQGPIILDGLGDISSKIPAYLSSGAKHGKYSAIKDYADYGGHDYLRRNKIKIKIKEGKKKTKIIGTDIGDLGIKEIRKLLDKRGPRKQNKNRNRKRPCDSDDSSSCVSHNKRNKKRPRIKSTKPTRAPDYYEYYPSDETTLPPRHKEITKLPPKDVDNANKKINEPDVDNKEQYDDDDDDSNSFNDRDKEGRDQDIDDDADNSDFGAPRLPDDYYDDVLNKNKPGTPTGTIGYIGKIVNHGHSGVLTNRWVNGNLVKTLSQKTDSEIETVSSKTRQHMSRVCVLHPHSEYCLGQEARRLLRLG